MTMTLIEARDYHQRQRDYHQRQYDLCNIHGFEEQKPAHKPSRDVIDAHLAAEGARVVDGQDAARYRWLRDKSEHGACAFYLSVGMALHGVRFEAKTVDSFIDSAMLPAAPSHKET